MPWKEISHRVSSPECGRADRLVATLLSFSRAQVRALTEAGGVKINGETCLDPGRQLQESDELSLRFDTQRRYREKSPVRPPATHGFRVLYEDEDLIVVDKEAGILTVPSERLDSQTLLHQIARYWNPQKPERARPAVVHRLDRDTSGALVFGKSAWAAGQLIEQFAARKPERRYVAIVQGRLERESGRIESLLSSDLSLTQRSGTRGELAITHYEVRERFHASSWVELELETGRRNQIRVHLSELGHPILGDRRYGPELSAHSRWPHRRLALHALRLGFKHPRSGADLSFEAPLPQEFLRFRTAEKKGLRSH